MITQKLFLKIAKDKPSWKVMIDHSEMDFGKKQSSYILTFVEQLDWQTKVSYNNYQKFMDKIRKEQSKC